MLVKLLKHKEDNISSRVMQKDSMGGFCNAGNVCFWICLLKISVSEDKNVLTSIIEIMHITVSLLYFDKKFKISYKLAILEDSN